MIVATALAVVAGGCGHAERRRAAPAAAAPTCVQLVGALRRTRSPDTTPQRRRVVRQLELTTRELKTRFGIDAAAVAELYAAVARVRQEAAHAIRDDRPTAARRLFAHARVLELRADALAGDLVGQCGP